MLHCWIYCLWKSFVLINVVHVLALSCNRWRIVARPGLKPRVFRWLCEHNHLATKPPGHLTNNFSPEPYPGYTLPGHFKFVHIFPVGKSMNSLYPSTKDIQTKPPLHSFFLCWEPFVTGEKLWLEPRAFCWPCKHSTTELPSHPVISPTTFHLNPTLVTVR